MSSTLAHVKQTGQSDNFKDRTSSWSLLHFSEGHLIGEGVSIPLLCADLIWTDTGPWTCLQSPFDRLDTEEVPCFRSILALAPRWKCMQMGILEALEDPRTDELWIVAASFIPGTQEMARCLQMLSKQGVIRWDIEKEFLFHKHVIGRSASGITRLGMQTNSFWSVSDMGDSETLSEDEWPASEKPVAIKFIKTPVNEVQASLMVNEIRHLAGCSHPNVLSLLGTFFAPAKRDPLAGHSTRSAWLLALEFCTAGTLSEYVSNHGHLDLIAGQVICTSLLSAAAHIHSKQIWHRDIRPQNIFLDTAGQELRPVLASFSRATHAEAEFPMVRQLGHGCYCAPEVLDSRLGVPGSASDIFSLGAVMLFLLTGLERGCEVSSVTWQPSLTGNSRCDEIAHGKLTETLVDFLLRLLALNARKRPAALEACRLLWEEAPEEVQESNVALKAIAALPRSGSSKAAMPIIAETCFEDMEDSRREEPRGGSLGYAPSTAPAEGYAQLPPGAASAIKVVPPSSPPTTPSPRKGRSFLSMRSTQCDG